MLILSIKNIFITFAMIIASRGLSLCNIIIVMFNAEYFIF